MDNTLVNIGYMMVRDRFMTLIYNVHVPFLVYGPNVQGGRMVTDQR